MKIYEGIEDFVKCEFAVVTSGTFDGVHVGHQKILKKVSEISRHHNGESVLITYWPHPRIVLNNDPGMLKLINTMEEKQKFLSQYGIDHLIKIPFTREFAQTTSGDFIKNILVERIGTKKLVIGYNHRFGRNREGTFEHLLNNSATYGFEVEEIPKHEIDHIGISSTIIRKALTEGDIHTANRYLGRKFVLTGIVIHGDKLGRKLGFPTANLLTREDYKIIPGNGTYAVWAEVNGNFHKGMLNTGIRPTIEESAKRTEVHLIDFDEDIYDKEIIIHYVSRIRDERKFNSLEDLKAQLLKDREKVKKILSGRNIL